MDLGPLKTDHSKLNKERMHQQNFFFKRKPTQLLYWQSCCHNFFLFLDITFVVISDSIQCIRGFMFRSRKTLKMSIIKTAVPLF